MVVYCGETNNLCVECCLDCDRKRIEEDGESYAEDECG